MKPAVISRLLEERVLYRAQASAQRSKPCPLNPYPITPKVPNGARDAIAASLAPRARFGVARGAVSDVTGSLGLQSIPLLRGPPHCGTVGLHYKLT